MSTSPPLFSAKTVGLDQHTSLPQTLFVLFFHIFIFFLNDLDGHLSFQAKDSTNSGTGLFKIGPCQVEGSFLHLSHLRIPKHFAAFPCLTGAIFKAGDATVPVAMVLTEIMSSSQKMNKYNRKANVQ